MGQKYLNFFNEKKHDKYIAIIFLSGMNKKTKEGVIKSRD